VVAFMLFAGILIVSLSSSSPPLGATSAPAFGSMMPVFTNNSFSGSSPAQIKVAELAQSTPSSAIGAFGPTLAGQATGAFNLPSFPTAQQGTSIFGDMQALAFGKQNMQNLMSETPVPVTNPFGTLPALTQMPIGKSAGSGPSVQYGISSMPRSEKPTQVQTVSLLTPRHITQQSKVHLHARRYHPKKDSPKVSFFSDADEVLTTPKADLMFIPRENPHALFICQPDQSSLTPRTSKSTTDVRDIAMPVQGNGESGPPESWPAPEKGNPPLYAGPMTSTKTPEIFSRDQVSNKWSFQGPKPEGQRIFLQGWCRF
jgi:nuclear pore complex protein Nup98-Nup96